MRVSVLTLVAAGVICAGAESAATPTLRVAPGPSLTLAGAGFVPRTVVVLRLKGPSVARLARVRSGRGGGFLVRFAVDGCSVTTVTAVGVGSRTARVPTAWFVRECPPPPPLAPVGNPG